MACGNLPQLLQHHPHQRIGSWKHYKKSIITTGARVGLHLPRPPPPSPFILAHVPLGVSADSCRLRNEDAHGRVVDVVVQITACHSWQSFERSLGGGRHFVWTVVPHLRQRKSGNSSEGGDGVRKERKGGVREAAGVVTVNCNCCWQLVWSLRAVGWRSASSASASASGAGHGNWLTASVRTKNNNDQSRGDEQQQQVPAAGPRTYFDR
jgi:hypothetical protein